MTTVLLFHHAQGLTDGVHWFAEQLRTAGHDVTTPDLYDGATFDTLQAGVAHAEEIGFEQLTDRGVAAAADLPAGAVVIGFSLGVLPAQKLAQTRPGLSGAVLLHSAVPMSYFGDSWPDQVALQLHLSTDDEVLDPGEYEVAEALAAAAADGVLYAYPGSGHLIADNSLAGFEPESAALILDRTRQLLDRVG
jgi:dienelactone hydrolase